MADYFLETHHHEWILTNRKGGYALGTGNLINQRKYHGLLVASDYNFQRRHLVSGLEEFVEWRGESFFLDSNNYSNCLYPEGFLHLVKSWLRPYPIFLYSSLPHNDDILIRKEIMMDENTNSVLIKYTNLGNHKLHLTLRPKYTLCHHHHLNAPGSLDHEIFENQLLPIPFGTHFKTKRESNFLEVYGAVNRGEIMQKRLNYSQVFYPWEVMAGYAGIGDQVAFWEITFDLGVNETNYLVFSDEPITDLVHVSRSIRQRYAALGLPRDYPEKIAEESILEHLDYDDQVIFEPEDYHKNLEFALQDFLANDDIVAGYPWFGAWGRDTMFTLNAFSHMKGEHSFCEQVLMKYSKFIRNGLIPNMLPESGKEGNYDSMDATLWYVILLSKLARRSKTVMTMKKTIEIMEEIFKGIASHEEGLFFIREDGLLELTPAFANATWMDVKLHGECVTPRDGAPVEINALWYNAIRCYGDTVELYNSHSKKRHEAVGRWLDLLPVIEKSFGKFWAEDYLVDRLIGEEQVLEFRPNALLAVALPYMLITREQAEQLFEKAKRELYTPYGIRTLSPKDFRFHKKYYGTQAERDLAYHQGTVWAWLLGPYCGVYLKAYRGVKSTELIREELTSFIKTLRTSFMKGHIASVAEVYDGDKPHFPKGAPAQAWSVAALYNIETYLLSLEGGEA